MPCGDGSQALENIPNVLRSVADYVDGPVTGEIYLLSNHTAAVSGNLSALIRVWLSRSRRARCPIVQISLLCICSYLPGTAVAGWLLRGGRVDKGRRLLREPADLRNGRRCVAFCLFVRSLEISSFTTSYASTLVSCFCSVLR